MKRIALRFVLALAAFGPAAVFADQSIPAEFGSGVARNAARIAMRTSRGKCKKTHSSSSGGASPTSGVSSVGMR